MILKLVSLKLQCTHNTNAELNAKTLNTKLSAGMNYKTKVSRSWVIGTNARSPMKKIELVINKGFQTTAKHLHFADF